MTRNIGEPCMCGDPACWVCGDGTPDDATGRGAATVPTQDDVMSLAVDYSCALGEEGGSFDEYVALARALDAIYDALDAALARAEYNKKAWHEAERAAVVANERATAAEAAAADLRARVDALTAEAAAGRALREGLREFRKVVSQGNPLVALGFLRTSVAAYDAATAPATTAAPAGEVPHV